MTCIRISLIILCTLLMEVLHGSSAFVRTPPSPTKAAERIVKVAETKTPLCQVLVTANPVAPLEGESGEPSEQEPGEAPSTVLSALLSDSDMHLSAPLSGEIMLTHPPVVFSDFRNPVHRPPIA